MYDAFDDGVDIDTERVVKAAQEIIPLSYTMKEGIDRLREWAKTRARIASPREAEDTHTDDDEVRQLEV